MYQFLQLVGILLAIAVLVVVFVLEMVGHLDVIQHKFPSLWVVMHSRPIIFALLIAILAFLQNDFKDALPSYPAPEMRIAAPVPPVIQITNVEPPPVVNVLPPQPKQRAYMAFMEPVVRYETGSQMSIDVRCTTKSEAPAQKVLCQGQFFVLPIANGGLDADSENKAYKQFEATTKPVPEDQRTSVSQGEVAYGTSFGPTLTKELQTAWAGGGYTVLVVGVLYFRDDVGPHRNNFCTWLQPPFENMPRVWHVCQGHSGIAY